MCNSAIDWKFSKKKENMYAIPNIEDTLLKIYEYDKEIEIIIHSDHGV